MCYFPGYHGWVLHWIISTKISNDFNNCYFNTHFDFFDEVNEIIVSGLNHLFLHFHYYPWEFLPIITTCIL